MTANTARSKSLSAAAEAPCEILKRAVEGRDAELAASVYAEDVELLIVNRNYPPSNPLIRRGRSAVLEFYRDVCAREMTHRITSMVADDAGFAMRESCQYPDGCRVLSHVIAEVRDGKIARQMSIDVWDE